MAIYTITGTATFSSQTNRNAAQTRTQTAIQPYTDLVAVATSISAGLTTSGSTILNFSFQIETDDDELIRNIRREVYDAWTASNRHTSGYLSSNRISP